MLENRRLALEFYADGISDAQKMGGPAVLAFMNKLGRSDLFFLMTRLLNRLDLNRDWLYDRCVEVQHGPDGYLDLWAREHYKSTIITYGKTIQDILDSHSQDSFYWTREVTVGIFSHTRPIAKKFLGQIMTEFETNGLLKQVYPDVLYDNPRREAPRWSLDNGIIVKRKSNPREATVEAWGLVDGQPTSMHFYILVYDDTVTLESVTPTQIEKTDEAWSTSLNLGADGGKRRIIGTRYHFNDTYRTMMQRGAVIPRVHTATKDGKPEGEPVLLSKEMLAEKRRDMGPYVFACQMLLNPKAEDAMGFKPEWLKFYDASPYQQRVKAWPPEWNYYLLCDPAGEKKKENDYTVILVIALAHDQNYYLVDGIRDRLNLVERTAKMFSFHRAYARGIKGTGYEKYGKDSDIEHISGVQETENYRFPIIPLGGAMAKNDRIRMLVPPFAAGSFYLPHQLFFTDYEGKSKDLVRLLIDDEYNPFPVPVHDDILDCMARIKDPKLGAVFPKPPALVAPQKQTYDPLTYR